MTSGLDKRVGSLLRELQIQMVEITGGRSQGRGRIERFFRTGTRCSCPTWNGYTVRTGRKPTLMLDSLENQFHTFLLEVYHRRPSSEGKLSPKERWEQGGFLPRMPDSAEKLDLLLIHEIRTRKIRTDGIHFHKFRYLSLTLATYVGEEVTIRFDPRDMGEIRVFYRDRFLCRAISADLAGQTVPLREIVNARKRRREQLRTIVKDRLKTVDTLLEFKRGLQREDVHASTVIPVGSKRSKLKRYFNE